MSDSWSQQEIEAAVSDYFAMLARELRGDSTGKTEHFRRIQNRLANRSKGAIERLRQNISAVLIELGYPYVDGFKPLGNYQQPLCEVIEAALPQAVDLQQAIAEAIERPVEAPAPIKDLLSLLMPPPRLEETEDESRNLAWRFRKTVPRDYLELEARDPALGRAGEEFVLQFEHRRLCDAGQKTLAGKIEHIARTEGDNAGYDIRSFENNGRERLIEVKTTRFGMMTPFFASKNEVRLSTEQQEGYHLYRLFKFGEQPRMFILSGALRDTCQLEPALYSARPR